LPHENIIINEQGAFPLLSFGYTSVKGLFLTSSKVCRSNNCKCRYEKFSAQTFSQVNYCEVCFDSSAKDFAV